jgi:hypothetical protein
MHVETLYSGMDYTSPVLLNFLPQHILMPDNGINSFLWINIVHYASNEYIHRILFVLHIVRQDIGPQRAHHCYQLHSKFSVHYSDVGYETNHFKLIEYLSKAYL